MTPFTSRPLLLAALLLAAIVLGLPAVSARSPSELVRLNPDSPNFPGLFSRNVKTGDPVAEPNPERAGREMLLAVYAYLSPSSPAVGDTAYRDRLLVLLDDRCGRWAEGKELADPSISFIWEASYAYYLLKTHDPGSMSEARTALYDTAFEKNEAVILKNSLLYDQGILANLWLNGDLRLAKCVYFGALARNDTQTAEKARRAIDTVMTRSVLGDGATRYVGFWGEVAAYRDESIGGLLWWWLITGSPSAKAAVDAALDSALVEFKESAGPETDLMRGTVYRYLAQDEQTRTITRKNFGTLSTSYRISRRFSSPATPNWDAGRTPWLGQQLWVLTGKRIIGLMQIVSDSDSTVYGLDARLVFTGGRRGIMGTFHELTQPDPSTFAFGDLRAKIHQSTFTAKVTQQRISISDAKSSDNFSALVRVAATPGDDAAVAFPTGTRRWIVMEITREGHDVAAEVKNLLPDDPTWAALQMDEGNRRIQIVQNLTSSDQTYRGDFVAGSAFPTTSLHRSWSDSVTHLDVSTGTANLTETIPAYGHVVAVSSEEPEDHTFSHRGSDEVYGEVAPISTLKK